MLEWHPTVAARPARGAVLPLRLDRHRPLQSLARSGADRRVVAAGRDRGHRDGQAQGAGRLDLRLLRRLGAQLPVLDRQQRTTRFGRFYEVQSYGPDIQKDLKLPPTATSREWYRPNPPLPSVDWGPRNNTNIQELALLFALDRVAKDRETLPRDLLGEEPARGGRRQAPGARQRLGDPGRPDRAAERRRHDQRRAPPGAGGQRRRRRLHRGRGQGGGRATM